MARPFHGENVVVASEVERRLPAIVPTIVVGQGGKARVPNVVSRVVWDVPADPSRERRAVVVKPHLEAEALVVGRKSRKNPFGFAMSHEIERGATIEPGLWQAEERVQPLGGVDQQTKVVDGGGEIGRGRFVSARTRWMIKYPVEVCTLSNHSISLRPNPQSGSDRAFPSAIFVRSGTYVQQVSRPTRLPAP